jgi:hypothetical protein
MLGLSRSCSPALECSCEMHDSQLHLCWCLCSLALASGVSAGMGVANSRHFMRPVLFLCLQWVCSR